MEYLLNFFEDLDEMVYISDMETNELVYMNRHLRNALDLKTMLSTRVRCAIKCCRDMTSLVHSAPIISIPGRISIR